jgi:spore germination protein GerM
VVTDPDLPNTELPTAPDTAFSLLAADSLRLLFKKAPENFPPGTKLIDSPKLDGDAVRVNLSKEFQTPEFWQGSTQTQMTVYSIVNTVAAVESGDDTKPLKVLFLVDGKPVDVLGELDVSEPLEPDMTLVAKS